MFPFDPAAFFFGILFVCAAALTLIGAVLKLLGMLLLSWWWIACPVPAVIVIGLILLGVATLFEQ